MGWRVVLAQRTPPLRAAAKRRSQAELACGVGPRCEVYGALAGRLIAQMPHWIASLMAEFYTNSMTSNCRNDFPGSQCMDSGAFRFCTGISGFADAQCWWQSES